MSLKLLLKKSISEGGKIKMFLDYQKLLKFFYIWSVKIRLFFVVLYNIIKNCFNFDSNDS